MSETIDPPSNGNGKHVPDGLEPSVEKQKVKKKKRRKTNRRQDSPPTEAQKRARFKPGQSGNPAGRPKGIPNLNHELREAVVKFRKGDKTYLQLIMEKALRNSKVAAKLLDKLLSDATAPNETKINNVIQNQQSAIDPEALKDDNVRDAAAILEERLFRVAPGQQRLAILVARRRSAGAVEA